MPFDKDIAAHELQTRANEVLDAHVPLAEHSDFINTGSPLRADLGCLAIVKDRKGLTITIEDRESGDVSQSRNIVSSMGMQVIFNADGELEYTAIDVIGPNGGGFTREIKGARVAGFLVAVLDAVDVEVSSVV